MKHIHILTLILCMSVFAHSQEVHPLTDPTPQLEQLRAANQDVKTIVCPYVLTHVVPALTDPQIEKGTFYYSSRQNGLALIGGRGKTVITSDMFLMVEDDKEIRMDARKNPSAAQMLSLIECCLSGNFDPLNKRGDVSYSQVDGCLKVSFVPTDRRMTRYLTGVDMIFDKQMSLHVLELQNKNGETHSYMFSVRRVNAMIPRDIFE